MLTRREEQVAELIAQGTSRRDVAATLSITLSAIDKQVHSLKRKFGAPSHSALALRCAEYLAQRATASAGRTEGPLFKQAASPFPPLSDRPPPPGTPPRTPPAAAGTGFAAGASFDALFRQLESLLAPFGVTNMAYSHIRAGAPGQIVHLASRWSLPEGVTFDTDLAPSDNPTFAYAMNFWDPMPLDLEAVQADAAYRLVPERIRRQHEHYIAAGLVRGITWPLPGLSVSDRLVLSAILRGVSAPRFAEILSQHGDRMRIIALDFRNAHVSIARPRFRLTGREAALLDRLAAGRTLEQAGADEGISRRAAERCLAAAREAMGLTTTPALVAAYLRNRSEPILPF